MDHPTGPPTEELTLFVYKVMYVDPDYIEEGLQKLAKSLPSDSPLAQTIDNAQYIDQSRSFVFRGPVSSIDRIKEILLTLDNEQVAEEEAEAKHTYFVYKLQSVSGAQVLKELEQTSKSVKSTDKEVYNVITNAKWIESTNSIILTGPHSAVEKVKAMIAKFDTPREKAPRTSSFYVYKPTTMSAEEFQQHVVSAAKEMAKGGLEDSQLIQAMESATLVSNKTAVMFTGTPDGIAKLKAMVQNFDNFQKQEQPKASEFFIYKPTAISADQLKKDILNAAKNMENAGLQDPELLKAMESVQADSARDRVTFTGTPDAIAKLKVMVRVYDSHEALAKTSNFYIFKPRFQNPDFIIKQAEHTASEMQGSGLADTQLINALNSGSVVSHGTAVLFTGTPQAISRLREIVPTFDVEKEAPLAATEFFVYKPLHISADDLRRHVRLVANDMENSDFSDPYLIKTLESARLVSNGKSVLFTGTPESIAKLKELLPALDTPTDEAIKQVGQTIFLIYKIKYTPAPVLMEYLKNMASDLARAGSSDEDLIKTLNKNLELIYVTIFRAHL